MLAWPVDNAFSLYLLLLCAAAVLLVAWWVTRKRGYLLALGVVAGLAGILFLLTLTVDTDRKQIVRALEEMVDGVKERNLDKTFRHIADDCTTRFQDATWNRDKLFANAQMAVKSGGVREIRLWGFDFNQVDPPRAVVFFNAKPFGGWATGAEYCGCQAEFRREGGRWRMIKLEVFQPGKTELLPAPR
jgi:hypothetical protein